ncbi:MAG: hypothetical protein CBD27_10240 [Rhodospirillaceae bacterium TMED167]|nr:hypothetical protein [Rhodospirillaceae bacterium]OUW24917.1 MAG: hypothetical protein CBD27_10240 [Rhodospirillaceae bacterium TMED167]
MVGQPFGCGHGFPDGIILVGIRVEDEIVAQFTAEEANSLLVARSANFQLIAGDALFGMTLCFGHEFLVR